MTSVELLPVQYSDATTTTPSKPRRNHHPPAVPSPPRLSRDTPPPPPHQRHSAKPIYMPKMTSKESSQWLFTDAEIASSPSSLDNIGGQDERCRRAKGVNFIIQAGIILKLPQLTLATASVFFHRFFMRCSMVEAKGGFHHYYGKLPRSNSHAKLIAGDKSLTRGTLEQNIAATALFLATKTEENCRKTKEIVISIAKVAQKNASLIIDEQSKEYWRWRDSILHYEEMMLEKLTFDVVLQSPYTFLYTFIQQLHIEDNKRVRNLAWSFINDSCLTTLCLLLPPKDIAVASIYFALRHAQETIPDDDERRPWWKQLGGDRTQIARAIGVMNEFWVENPLGKSDNPFGQSPVSSEEDNDRTRRPYDGGSLNNTPTPQRRRNSHDSQNGISQQDSAANGNGTAEHTSSQAENNRRASRDVPAPTTEGASANDETAPTVFEDEGSGSSDALLKAAANDPATHQQISAANGLAGRMAIDTPPQASPKRKYTADAKEPPPKRNKPDEKGPLPSTQEESEEGELAES